VRVWLDAQLSPVIAVWLSDEFGLEASPIRDHGLVGAKDREIFFAARAEGAAVMTKDADFVRLVRAEGPPPQVVWITCGNTSNASLQHILRHTLADVLKLLTDGEALVEVSDVG